MIPEINKNEYERLFNEEIDNQTSWIFKSNLCVNSFINDLFEENKFLYRLFSDSDYTILNHQDVINYLKNHFDYYCAVSLKNNVSKTEAPEVISGIMDFSYISWDKIKEIIDKLPGGWVVFIINPILMRYEKGSIGLFLIPKYKDNYYIGECNNFIKSRTGYPLFLEYVKKDTIEKIEFDKPELTIEKYVLEMKKYCQNKGLNKLLDFWQYNECVNIDAFEDSFNDFKDNLPYSIWDDINFKDIKSTIPFELIPEETGEVLGPYNRFCLDKSFKLADVDDGVLKLTDSQINDLIEGKYDFKLVE
ncbi:hypothetical protein [uncultured Methanobrevibacter sp.]|uniref:hypothetical protein n=1 Tax=uncultured Methanobrevibacter sp. TaxID=253161 RepID=UPI0025D2C179|nr:hypothetical protein [uncultured Methanobrevibacter sp.]